MEDTCTDKNRELPPCDGCTIVHVCTEGQTILKLAHEEVSAVEDPLALGHIHMLHHSRHKHALLTNSIKATTKTMFGVSWIRNKEKSK
jgi:hypothetical protein